MTQQTSNILFVDDEPMILSSLNMLFKRHYKVFMAENGFAALDIIRSVPIKVIISDQRMPGMLGHELLREVKELSPNTVRMLLTGYSDLDAIIGSVNAGEIFRFINKPWQSDFMLHVVKLGVDIYDKITNLQVQELSKEPVTTEGEPASGRSVHIEVEEENSRVMFIDYNEEQTNNLIDKFQHAYDVVGVNSVDDAFAQLAKKPVSVIVSNVSFGEVDGISFLDTIRREYPNIVTVILTEVRDATLAIRSINELNVFRYLVRPAQEQQIEKTLQMAVERSKAYQRNPTRNVRQTAEKISPTTFTTTPDESSLRLRLRAAQALLAKSKLKDKLNPN